MERVRARKQARDAAAVRKNLDAVRTAAKEGRNLMPALRSGQPPASRPIFVERPHYSPEGERFMRALTTGYGFGELVGVVAGNEKLIRYPDGTRQLFDLAPEPKMFLEIAGDHNAGFFNSRTAYMNGMKEFLDTLD